MDTKKGLEVMPVEKLKEEGEREWGKKKLVYLYLFNHWLIRKL